MGLPKILQIPSHHVLANQNALKFKKGAPLKQFFNINFGDRYHKKKLLFLFVFSTYLPMFLLKFQSESSLDVELNSASNEYPLGILWQTPLPQKQKYLKKQNDDIIIPFFHVFLVFGVEESVKSMPIGYSLDVEFNSACNELSRSKFE